MSETESLKKTLPRQESPDPGVKVLEMGHCARSAWDLFVLFGADRMDEFKSLALKSKDKGLDSGYTMLIGASRIHGDKAAFEDIAVDYAVQFGMSPPAWFEGHTRQQQTGPSALEINVSNFSSDTIIETTVKMETPRPLILNLGHVHKVDAAGVDLFSESLNGRIAQGHKTKIVNSEKMTSDLVDKLVIISGKPHPVLWDFCFQIFRLTNAKTKFDQACTEYGKLGGHAPSWKNLAEPEEELKEVKSTTHFIAGKKLSEISVNAAKSFLATDAGARARESGHGVIDMSMTVSGSLTDAIGVMSFIQCFREQKVKVSLVNVNEIFVLMFASLAIQNMVESVSAPGLVN